MAAYSSESEQTLIPDAVTNYHFVNKDDDPVPFSRSRFFLSKRSEPESQKEKAAAPLYLHGTTPDGLRKVFQPVSGWSLDLSGRAGGPRLSVLSQSKWMELLKPRKIYEPIIRTILVSAQALHFLCWNPDAPLKSFWDHIRRVFDKFEVRPSEDDLRPHLALMKLFAENHDTLAKSQLLKDFLEGKGMRTAEKAGTGAGASRKLAFSLKSKSKFVAAPVKLGMDEEEEGVNGASSQEPAKRQRVGLWLDSEHGGVAVAGVPLPPGDYTVRKVIDRLANLVAKNGRQHEHITRQRNPGDTPFKFLFDKNCSEYKYYEHRLQEEEKALVQSKDSHAISSHHGNNSSTAGWSSGSQRGAPQQKSYQTPASALYGSNQDATSSGAASGPPLSDPVAMMEFYMKKAAQEERKRPPRLSKDEMPPPPSLQASGSGKKGHHMGDFIPQEELEKFMARCNDAAAQKAAQEAAQKAKIQADNIGHKLLSKMGWKEGEGLGSEKSGRSEPVMAGDVKKDNLGVGAVKPGEVSAEDDIYEQYKKRMMLGYKYRPNPLGNPRKAYY